MHALHALPPALLSLLNAALVNAQSPQSLGLNVLLSFNSSAPPNPPTFILPKSSNLSISVALCSGSQSPPWFFITNDTTISNPGPDGGTNVFEIQLQDGYGNWTGPANNGGTLAVQNIGQNAFEVAAAEGSPAHEHLPTPPYLGDSTSNQAIIFSPPFAQEPITRPTWPNYTLPAANLSFPTPPSNLPNFTLVLAPTSGGLSALPQTGCALRASQNQAGSIANQNAWLRDASEGWREQWLMGNLAPQTNYTAYTVQDGTKVGGPMYFATKSAAFSCALVHSLPYCPAISYAVPLPPPAFPAQAYDSTNLPNSVASPLLEYMTNFTTTLSTFACGRDAYSPLKDCFDCQTAYRHWLCAISFTRCGESSPSSSSTTSTPVSFPTGGAQTPFSALLPQATGATPRNPNMGPAPAAYSALLPCLETCTAVDRACPNFMGFRCPVVRFNANVSYGVGIIDSGEDGEEGGGSAGGAQDRWGNVWCNGS